MISSYFSNIVDHILTFIRNFSWPNLNFRLDLQSREIELIICILLILFISFAVDRLLVNSFFGMGYRLFVSPGVILHELSHALLCFLTGAKIKSISLFDKEGGSVEHEPSKIPIIGPILISIAPFVAGVTAIYFLSNWLGMKQYDFNTALFKYQDIVSYFKNLIATINLSDYKNWVIIYLALSVAVTMTPSKQDMKNILIPVSFLLLLAVATFYFKLSFMQMINFPTDRILVLLSPILLLLILALVFSIIIFALTKVFKNK
jgi:hypothetical protein